MCSFFFMIVQVYLVIGDNYTIIASYAYGGKQQILWEYIKEESHLKKIECGFLHIVLCLHVRQKI